MKTALYSPIKQSRFEKGQGPFINFQSTTQLTKGQLAGFRKEVRNNVSQKEASAAQSHEKANNFLFTSWRKESKTTTNEPSSFSKFYQSSPRKQSKLSGGLNADEIFHKKKNDSHSNVNHSYNHKQMQLDALFNKPSQTQNTLSNDPPFQSLHRRVQSNTGVLAQRPYNGSPQKSQYKLDRYKTRDAKLDIQLQIQNTSISKRVTPPKDRDRSFNRFDKSQENLFDQLRPLTSKNVIASSSNFFQRALTPTMNNRYIEKVPMTDLVRMTSHFSQLSSQEIQQISKGYLLELNNLYTSLERIIRQNHI